MRPAGGPPRLGFIGLGWIGGMRLNATAASGDAIVAALCDRRRDRLAAAGGRHPEAERFIDVDALLERADSLALDGVVVATPNALHARQAIAAFEHGLAVFCQKPLGRNEAEVRTVVDAARRADRLLGVDYSYRYTDGARTLRALIERGALGRVFRVESVFHNAYGPDKAWCRDPVLAGGGALMDLGVHQVDLPLWLLGAPRIEAVRGTAFREGRPLDGHPGGEVDGVDDFAVARLELEGGAVVTVDVSWNAHAGADCVFRVAVFGTRGGAVLRNVDGSFYDFELKRFTGRRGRVLRRESREWMGRCIRAWARRLAGHRGYSPAAEASVAVARVIDAVYGVRTAPAGAGVAPAGAD
ncbi:MAG: Gfo/Idh/MocA family protein [Gemmatimonadota bacterium]